jgi:hypothetical protein
MNQSSQQTIRQAKHRRGGFAPMELVLLAPFLVFMAALMIDFADASLFKIRAQGNVHYAATQTEPFRASSFALGNQQLNPQPQSWPTAGTIGSNNTQALQTVDNYWNQPGFPDSDALQGNSGSGRITTLTNHYEQRTDVGNSFMVDRDFQLEEGMREGRVTIQRTYPMLQTILPNNGRYSIDHDYEFLEGDWNYGNVGLQRNSPTNNGSIRTEQWRANDLYHIHPTEMPQLFGYWSDFMTAFNALRALSNNRDTSVPNADDLDALDADVEWTWYRPGWPRNFHVDPNRVCEIDLEDYLASGEYSAYLRRVRLVPKEMCRAWQGVYGRELSERQDPNYVPMGPLSDQQLQDKLDQLDVFEQGLRNKGYW